MFDSFCCQDTTENIEVCELYIKEIRRILKNNGKFIIISLLQPFVLKTLTQICQKYFGLISIKTLNFKNFNKFSIFYIVLTQNKKQNVDILLNGAIETNLEKEIYKIQNLQYIKYYCCNLK